MGCRLAEAVWIYFFFDGYFSLSLLKSELNSDINQPKLSPIYIQTKSESLFSCDTTTFSYLHHVFYYIIYVKHLLNIDVILQNIIKKYGKDIHMY